MDAFDTLEAGLEERSEETSCQQRSKGDNIEYLMMINYYSVCLCLNAIQVKGIIIAINYVIECHFTRFLLVSVSEIDSFAVFVSLST